MYKKAAKSTPFYKPNGCTAVLPVQVNYLLYYRSFAIGYLLKVMTAGQVQGRIKIGQWRRYTNPQRIGGAGHIGLVNRYSIPAFISF
jgi:hypothetical protein